MDYCKLEEMIFDKLCEVAPKIIDEFQDVYAIALDLHAAGDSIGIIANCKSDLVEFEEDEADYFYYKYCEMEWSYFDLFEEITEVLKKELEDNIDCYKDGFKYTDRFYEHKNNLDEVCIKALCRYKEKLVGVNEDILLMFALDEGADADEAIQRFERINGSENVKEYAEHIDDFC